MRVCSNLLPRNHCSTVGNRAHMVFGFMSRGVSNRNAEVILKFYMGLGRSHLEYAVQFWYSY